MLEARVTRVDIREDEEGNRVQLVFHPRGVRAPEAVADDLRRNKWRYSPTLGVWQQRRNKASLAYARSLARAIAENDTIPGGSARTRDNQNDTRPGGARPPRAGAIDTRPGAGEDREKAFTLRAKRAGQQVLDTLRQYCGATTQAGSIWTALEGYVRVSEELKASRERIAHLEGILQDIILADADVEQAAANRAEVMDAARKESPTTDTRRRSAG